MVELSISLQPVTTLLIGGRRHGTQCFQISIFRVSVIIFKSVKYYIIFFKRNGEQTFKKCLGDTNEMQRYWKGLRDRYIRLRRRMFKLVTFYVILNTTYAQFWIV